MVNVDNLLSCQSTSFTDLFQSLKRGRIERDCQFNYLDKLNNIKFGRSVVYISSLNALKHLKNPMIVGVITTEEIANVVAKDPLLGVWVDSNPEELFYLIHDQLVQMNFYYCPWKNKISARATVSPHARLGEHSITIGDGCIVEDNVVIKPFTIVGNDTILRSSCDVGSDGFEAHRILGRLRIIRHGGLIVIGNNVEIQSLVTLSRGLFPSRNTVISDNVKIADLVHIAHGVHVGPSTMITAGCTVAGNTTIGENVFIGPGSIISNRLTIGDCAFISIGSVVVRNVKEGSKVSGNFAYDHNKMIQNYTNQSI